jgi:hypothetical protein
MDGAGCSHALDHTPGWHPYQAGSCALLDATWPQGHVGVVSDLPNHAASDPAPLADPWRQLQAWRAEGLSREEWLTRLKGAGLDDESARVLVNSLDGANPSLLPEASFSPGVNPLAPASFALDDLGLQGPPVTVGLYWMAFGATLALMVGVFAVLVWTKVVDQAPDALLVLARALATLGAVAFGWGAFKAVTSVRVRRR